MDDICTHFDTGEPGFLGYSPSYTLVGPWTTKLTSSPHSERRGRRDTAAVVFTYPPLEG